MVTRGLQRCPRGLLGGPISPVLSSEAVELANAVQVAADGLHRVTASSSVNTQGVDGGVCPEMLVQDNCKLKGELELARFQIGGVP